MQDKLRAAKADADAAAASMATVAQETKGNQEDNNVDETTRRKKTPLRKTRVIGRPRRRKSTLSPEELAQLITGS